MRTIDAETINESKVMPCPATATDVSRAASYDRKSVLEECTNSRPEVEQPFAKAAIATFSLERQKRYRQLHRRFDYVPAADVLPIIESYLSRYPDRPMREILDAIVRTAQQHMKKCVTGNAGSKT